MRINIKTSYDNREINNILSSKIVSSGNLGVNWVSKTPDSIIYYYEDGRKNTHGVPLLLKSLFLGHIVIKNGDAIVKGFIFSGLFTHILLIASLILEIISLYYGDLTGIIGCLLVVLAVVVIYVSETKNRKSLYDYTIRLFGIE